jgi:DNA repair exonuclease SbcCD ATPase subunit
MEPLTIRIRQDTKQSLEDEAAEYDVSVSEYVRQLIEKGREYDDLADRLDSREERIAELESELSRRSQIEEKIENLPDKMRDAETYQERRQRLLDRASVGQRLKWKVTGVPVDELTDD